MDRRLGRTVRRIRVANDLDLLDIARVAGVSQATLSRFERKGGWPARLNEIVEAYAAACGLQPGDLWRQALEDEGDA